MTGEKELAPSTVGVTRGFLFADLRGYTSYLEANGAAAATELLTRYRTLVRDVVAQHDGAEIRTEGDGFYVVFSSVSSAVRAGLEILDGARAANQSTPTAPIRTAIGVHAGETMDSEQGYVGAAVNIAARLCAQATAGELLVTDTVRTLTASVLPVSFVPAGKRRLKGVPDAVAVFRVVQGRVARPVGRRARPVWLILAAVLVIGAVAGLAVVGLPGLLGPAASPTAAATSFGPSLGPTLSADTSATPNALESPRPLAAGPLLAGTYVTRRFSPATIFTVGDGWTAKPEAPDFFTLSQVANANNQVSFHWVRRASVDGCYSISEFITGQLGLYDWLTSRPELNVGTIVHGSVPTVESVVSAVASDTAPTWQVDLTVDSGATCDTGSDLVYFFPLSDDEPTQVREADRWLAMHVGDRSRIVVAGLDQHPVTIVVTTLTEQDFATFAPQADELIAGLRFVQAP